jgi:hypothetical protein
MEHSLPPRKFSKISVIIDRSAYLTIKKMRMYMNKSIVFIALALVLSSCATITRGTSQAFSVTSDPTASTVTFSNGLSCTTPCSIEAKRKPGFSVTATKEGYKSVTTSVISSISGGGGAAMAGNIVLGGIIGGAVDASNGAMNELSPNPLHIVMERIE